MTRHAAPARGIRITAAALLAIEIAIHAYLAPDHLSEVRYIGAAFVAATLLLTVTVTGLALAPRSTTPWTLGALLCTGMAIAFLVSRTTGLPGYHEAWTSDGGLGLLSLPPEAAFVAITLRSRSTRPPWISRSAGKYNHIVRHLVGPHRSIRGADLPND